MEKLLPNAIDAFLLGGQEQLTNPTDYLGMYWGEEPLAEFLAGLEIADRPALARGDWTCFLSSHKKGVELTFKDAAEVETSGRSYPEGALVLVNIRFYGAGANADFKPYTGALPNSLRFGMPFDDALSAVGPVQAGSRENRRARWDYDKHCVFATFAKDDRLKTAGVQLPVAV